ncbi:hypothetical protein V6Z11_A02G051800 [Gossypium hirsutum]
MSKIAPFSARSKVQVEEQVAVDVTMADPGRWWWQMDRRLGRHT